MPLRLVVDTSVAVKGFFPEELTDLAQKVLTGESELHAPELLLLEFDSVLCRRVRRKELSIEDAADARSRLRRIPIRLHPVAPLLDESFAVAAQWECSPYDCLYLALAVRLGAKLATADGKFRRSLAGSPLGDFLLWLGDVR
jgi:predicted nucleic acid-binding protein